MYWMNYWATVAEAAVQAEHRHRTSDFFCLKNRTSAIITESAEFYYPIVSVIIQQLRPRHANNKS